MILCLKSTKTLLRKKINSVPKLGSINQFGTFKFGTYSTGIPLRKSNLGEGLFSKYDTVVHPRVGKVVFSPEFIEGLDAPSIITSLTDSGGILYKGTDLISQALKDALEESIVSYDLKFYIQDNNSNWIDFTDRTESSGRNALRRLGNITFSAERLRGQLQQTIGRVVLDNTDNFWDSPFPPTLKAELDSNFKTIPPTDHSFDLSFNMKEVSLSRKKAAIRAHVTSPGTTTPIVMTLGVYLIEEIETNEQDKSATIKFSPLSTPLIESKAKNIKNGALPWQNRSSNFLVRELLKNNFAQADRSLPVGFDIDDISHVKIPYDGSSAWAQGFFGRPPEKTYRNSAGTVSTTATWEESSQIVRAMSCWNYDTGTISITSGSAVVRGSSTSWSKTSSNAHNRLKIGDPFIIPKQRTAGDTGALSGHHGFFTIIDIDETNQEITLNKTPSGTQDEEGLSYSISRLYIAAGTNLYEYNITNDTYSEMTTSSTEVGGTDENYIIRKIWINTADTEYPIYTAAIRQDHSHETAPAPFKIHKFKWNGDTNEVLISHVYSTSSTSDGISLGDMVSREPEKRQDSGLDYFLVGTFEGDLDAEQLPITIPFSQTIHDGLQYGLMNVYDINSFNSETNLPKTAYNGNEYTLRAEVERGHYVTASAPNAHRPVFSLGASGFLELTPTMGSKGTIWYANGPDPTMDTDNSDNTTVMREFSYRSIDLSTGVQSNSTPGVFTGGTSPSSGTFSAYQFYTPTSGCVDEDGDVFVGLTLFRSNLSETSRLESSRSAIIKIESTSSAVEVFRQTGSGTDSYAGDVFTEMIATRNGSSKRLYAVSYRQEFEKSANNNRYAIVLCEDTDSVYGALTLKFTSDSPIQGLGVLENGTPSSPDPKVYFQEGGQGIIKHVNEDTSSLNTSVNASDIPHSESGSYVMDNRIVYIPNGKTAFWISSSAPAYTTAEDKSGKFYLNIWSFMHPTRIELADFGDMNIWEALGYISEICDARYGFTSEGNFFFKETPRHLGSSYNFTNVGQDRIFNMIKGRGHTGIINVSNRVPNRAVIGETEVSVELRPSSRYGTGNNRHTIEASQRDLLPKSINLKCIKGGAIRGSSSDTDGAEFEFRVFESTFKTALSSSYDKDSGSAAYAVNLEGVEGIVYGSSLNVTGVDSNDNEISSSSKVGHQVTYGGLNLITSGSIDDNQTDLTLSLDGGSLDLGNSIDDINRHIQANDILLIGNIDGTSPQWEYVSVVSKRGAQSLTVSRGAWGGLSPIEHDSESRVWLIKNGLTVYLKKDNKFANSHNAGDEVTSDQPSTDKSSLDYRIDPNDSTSGSPQYVLWKPINKEFVSVGEKNTPYDTGLSIRLSSESNSTQKFSIGDVIRLKAQGLVLQEDSPSLQSASNPLSIKRWQRREASNNRNPFLSILQARWSAKRDIEDEAHPKYVFTMDTIMAPWISLLHVVTVQDPDALPKSKQYSEKAYITSISMSPQSRGSMSITLKTTQPY